MTNKNHLENRYPILQGEIKTAGKIVPFTYVGYNLNFKTTVNQVVSRLAGLIEDDWFLLRLADKTRTRFFSGHLETLVTGSFKQDGVEMLINYPQLPSLEGKQTYQELLIEEVKRLYNIRKDKVVRRHEEYEAVSGDLDTHRDPCKDDLAHAKYEHLAGKKSHKSTEVSTWYETLGVVASEDDKITITYKDGSVIVLTDFAVIDTSKEITELRSISEAEYENNSHYRLFEEEIPW